MAIARLCRRPWTPALAAAFAKIESESPGSVKVTLAPEDVWLPRWDGPERGLHEIGGRIALNVYNFARASGVSSSHREPPSAQRWLARYLRRAS